MHPKKKTEKNMRQSSFFLCLPSSSSPHVTHPNPSPPLYITHLIVFPPPIVAPHVTLFISLSDTVEVTGPVFVSQSNLGLIM